ncbi:DHA2 family efflux MFS transporter permease subunit [Micromonospora sp. NPDC049523]|uniref:DHA2 family efflux MFS transporter permease subunit n=1 Tax=Micromonospora sp. NPDC049523 TaxID=3155921 RepID=UPI00342517C7
MTTPRPVNPWAALAVLCLGNFLILLDTSIVNTAAPVMMSSLDTGIGTVLWVLNGYLLALSTLLIVFGRLGDLVGPRAVFVGGLGVFALASLLCGAAQSPGQLIAARVLQGIGAAALLPQALVLLSAIFPPARRGAAFGIFTAVAGIAAVSGPTAGGLIVTHLGWQWIFYVNVPLSLAGIVLALRLVPDLRQPRPKSFDPVGLLLATLGLSGLVYALVEGERHHWGTIVGPVTVPLVLVAAGVLLGLFVLWERRQPEPLVPLGLLRNRDYTIATVITLITSFALYGFLLVFVIETQTLYGMTPLMSGLVALPWTITLSAVAPVAGRLADRLGGRILLVFGLAAFAFGVLGMAYLPARDSGVWVFFAPLVLIGIGMGAAIAPTTTEAMRGIVPAQAGAASGVLNTARQVGAALGAAVIGAVLQNRLVASLHDSAQQQAERLPSEARPGFVAGFADATEHGLRLGSGQQGGFTVPEQLPPDLAERVERSAAEAFGDALLASARPTLTVVAAVLLLGSVLATFMVRRTRAARVAAAQPEQVAAERR